MYGIGTSCSAATVIASPPATGSVLESQDDLGVVVEDLVDVLGGQAALADVVERLPVRLEGEQDRVVAPRHEMIGPEGLPGAEEGGLGAVAHGVVEETTRGHARALGQIWILAWGLVVQPLEQHRDDAAEMGDDVLDVRVALGHAASDQVQDDGGVLEG